MHMTSQALAESVGSQYKYTLTRSLRDSKIYIDLVQGPPGSKKERVIVVVSYRAGIKLSAYEALATDPHQDSEMTSLHKAYSVVLGGTYVLVDKAADGLCCGADPLRPGGHGLQHTGRVGVELPPSSPWHPWVWQ